MKARNKRLAMVMAGIVGVGAAAGLIFYALGSGVSFYYSPTQVQNKEAPADRTFRLGGMVKEGSLQRENDGLTVHFIVTDFAREVDVTYKGILPDLFQEGQGVVAQGKLGTQGFVAEEVLAKHDESYMSPEVAEMMEKGKKMKEAEAATGTGAGAGKLSTPAARPGGDS